jgi:hypothetical protein
VHPAMSKSTEPMIALNKVICLITCQHLSLGKASKLATRDS